jgi:hypothetical protein
MGGFADALRQQAAQALRTMFQHDPDRRADPVLELIGFLLEDGAGGVLPLPDTPVTTEQWLTWNRLWAEHPRALARAVTQELERERLGLPQGREAMRTWAAQVLLSTLDRLEVL